MPVDNAGAPTSGDPFQYVVIPINKDVLPYAQLEAQDKYKSLSMPDDLPPTLGVLAASDKNFQGDMLSTDGKRNLNVHVVNGSGTGGGVASYTLDLTNSPSPFIIDISGDIPAGKSLLGVGGAIYDFGNPGGGTGQNNVFTIGLGDWSGSGAFANMADGFMGFFYTTGPPPVYEAGVPANLQLGQPIPFAELGMDPPINIGIFLGGVGGSWHEGKGHVRVWYV